MWVWVGNGEDAPSENYECGYYIICIEFLMQNYLPARNKDKQGLDGFSTNNQCNMIILTTEDKLRSVFY